MDDSYIQTKIFLLSGPKNRESVEPQLSDNVVFLFKLVYLGDQINQWD